MSLRDYLVNRDKFEPEEWGTMAFPCCACKSVKKLETEEPCRTCDHNINAVHGTPATGKDIAKPTENEIAARVFEGAANTPATGKGE